MASSSRARDSDVVSSGSAAATMADLPDAVLEHSLGFLPLKHRLRAALVCERFAALCDSRAPAVEVRAPASCKGARKLQFLSAWLARHAQHVQKLSLSIHAADPYHAADDATSMDEPIAACIAAVAAAGQLTELSLKWRSSLSTDLLLPLHSLRQLVLSTSGSLDITPAISQLSALQSLDLIGGIYCVDDVRLPPSITRLIATGDDVAELPEQLAQLTQLQRLRFEACSYYDQVLTGLSALSSSLTRLEVHDMDVPSGDLLASLTALQHFTCLMYSEEDGTAVAAALTHLTGLTCLILWSMRALDPPLPALSGLSRLQLCDLQTSGNGDEADEGGSGPPLPAGPWLASLRWLSVGLGTLLTSTPLLQEATALECVSVLHSPGAQHLWALPPADAFFDWLARHPPLRRLSLECGPAAYGSNEFVTHLARLCRRRPGLLVQRSDMCTEDKPLSDYIWETDPIRAAAAVCHLRLLYLPSLHQCPGRRGDACMDGPAPDGKVPRLGFIMLCTVPAALFVSLLALQFIAAPTDTTQYPASATPTMRRTLVLFAACALLLAHGAHAKCTADKVDADPVSGCKKCAKDGSKCLECSDHFGLTSDGTCVRCTVPGFWGDQCTKCDGDKPDICLTCAAACGRRSCTGLYASEGRCEPCGDSCADCNAKGACIACGRFTGLINGTCERCAENCSSCREDASKCDDCTTGYGLAKNGTCVPCNGNEDGGVMTCDASGKPTDCYSGWFLKDGACVKCGEHCSDCKDEKTCNSCDMGYGPSKVGAKDCVPCKSANCTSCSDDFSKCTSCDTSFGLVGDACVACEAANCFACDGNAKVCTACASNDTVNLGTDKATGGCVPCKDANCQSCDDAAVCSFCKDGFGLDEKAGTCKPCPDKATACTFNATGTFVDLCADGFGPDKAGKECKACGVEHCNSCDKLGAGFCDIYGCAEGFGYSDQENTCFACSEGCASCSETACSYCKSGWAFADRTEKACTKCVDGDKRPDCEVTTN